ncbi:hypothetical protein C4D60_Mb10t07960 [Musa balbisiana]|uniref:DNA replication complex GINS protein PSF2 n=1 Tax=Musa balbisiana TaxID=52838 RepID=A0A4S8IVF7_MUSBA|nr:hypothetical protein C4D60_Mb10t07960 [Musa balbisiana]
MAGQSDPHLSVFSPPEVEFLAEDEKVEIIPKFSLGSLHMICGDFGPFRPNIASEVPLWLAVALKERGKCDIRAPDWMSVDKLMQILEAERESPREFQPLPFHYIEISKLLFKHAHDNIQDIYMVSIKCTNASCTAIYISLFSLSVMIIQVRSLIEDIRDVRFHKVETGLQMISGRTHAVKALQKKVTFPT